MHFKNPLTSRQMLSQILSPAFECGMSIFHSLIGLITIEEPLWEIMRNRRKKGCCMPFPPPESFLSVAQLTSHDLKSFKMWTLSTIRTILNVYHPSFINKENQFLPTTNEFSCSARMGEGESNAVAGSLLNTLHQSSLVGEKWLTCHSERLKQKHTESQHPCGSDCSKGLGLRKLECLSSCAQGAQALAPAEPLPC